LAARADGLMNNLRGDLPGKLGLTYQALAPANPRIVCAHLSAYGRSGSRADWPGYDYLMQAETGYLSLTGEPDGPPARMGLSIVDLMTGLFAAFALVSGVLEARTTGTGRDLDVSLFDCALQNLSYLATWYLNGRHVQGREPRSAHPSLVPSQLYRTRDGFIFICATRRNSGRSCASGSATRNGPKTRGSAASRTVSKTAASSPSCSTPRCHSVAPASGSIISPGWSPPPRSMMCVKRSTTPLFATPGRSANTVARA
jgi:crotonobetainyl-CoA:carnitine CoA-transferase CaiB-like acyl-CoA transferase